MRFFRGNEMMISLEMRELSRCLLAYEASAGKASGSMELAILRVYETLRQSLIGFAGVAGFQSLASRALALARQDVPSLSTAQVTADGSLVGLAELGPQIGINTDQAGEYQTSEGGVILIARLLELLLIFLGEALTLRLLRNAWPAAAFDDCNSKNGRKT
jgi:hypothetical protein